MPSTTKINGDVKEHARPPRANRKERNGSKASSSPTPEWQGQLRDLWEHTRARVEEEVKARPLVVLGVAVGVGVLIGGSVRSSLGRAALVGLASRLVNATFESDG